jgi:hypothetical protein
MARPVSVLVVASVTADSPQLVEAIREREQARGPLRVTLLMPCSGPGLGTRDATTARLAEVLAHWREHGIEDAQGVVGDQQPTVAVLEIWDPLAYDEIVVCTFPDEASTWLRWDVPHRIAQATDANVVHVVAPKPADTPRVEPLPQRERSPLGPLSILSWGHPKQETEEERLRRLRALQR